VIASAADGRLRLIAALRVADEYLPYLDLAPRSWPDQAQRVMAITARSRALAAVYDPACGCHLPDTGLVGQRAVSAKGYAAWRKAVTSTSGVVASFNGSPVDIPVFDSSGGATSNAADVWGTDVPWLKSVEDPWSLKPKNTPYATWDQQTRAQSAVAKVFGLSDVVRLDLRQRLTGGAVATAVATSAQGQTATITGEQLRTALRLPSAYIARSVDPAPVSATALSEAMSAQRSGVPVVAQASDTVVVALAAAYAGAQGRPLYVIGPGGPTQSVRRALRTRRMTAVGAFSAPALRALDRAGSVRRITAADAPALSVQLARAAGQRERRPTFLASAGNPAAMASAAMAAARASGYLLAVGKSPAEAAVSFTKARATRTVVVAAKKEIPNAAAAGFRKPVRLGSQDPVARASRLAALGPRRGEVILVDAARPMAAAAAAATRRPVLLVHASASNAKALRFVQSSPAIAVLRSVGVDPAVVSAVRRA
jgi:SpoIID/LytB domain protein